MKNSLEGLKRAYLYISRNEHSLKEKTGEIRGYISRAAEPGIDLKVFDTADRQSLDGFEAFASAPSLFSERKAVLLEHIQKAPAAFQKKAAKMISEEASRDTIFILTAPSQKINRALLEAVRKQGVVRTIKPPESGDLLKWLDKKSGQDGIEFTEDAAHLLVENVNLDINLLKSEYGKLYDYISSEEEKRIDAGTVKALVRRVYSMKIFDLVDLLGQRDKNKSLEALNDILNEDKNLLGLITLLHRMFKSMLYIKSESGGKDSVTDYLARNINMPPYFISKMVNKYIKFSKNYSQAEIIRIIGLLNHQDIELRRSTIDSSRILRTLIARITGINGL